ncbi:lysocardiolipin acyltransferase 1 isoform X2 [Hydra vulgaris]|uniref:Lysocardiolipin acyltransferase 1 isoform X2 n=2 Tax=Hydra vulgaris TaxID=6087 RepID=A0ABM4CK94_HYDVU
MNDSNRTGRELFYGTKVVITGDQVDSSKSALIVMNHRCRLDWMFYWMVHLRTGRLGNEKIIMRGDLKNMVGFGWCMQNVMYFFLQRRWDLDHIYLDRMLNYFIDINYPLQLFIFPEGTNMCKRGKSKSDSFAEKNGLPIYQYVLHPHVKGFNYLVQKLRGKVIDSIHDVTIGYPKNLCYGEKDLITGNFPLEIHVHFKSYKISDIPIDSDSLDEWCKKIWLEKEERLKKFYENGEFIGEPVHYNDKSSLYKYNSIMGLVNLFWATFLLTCVYSLWWCSFARWYSVLMVIFYVFVSFFGGVDKLQLYLHDKIKNKQNLQ